MGYSLSKAAQDDLIRIYLEGAEQFGRIQADKYHDALEATFGLISEFPHMARLREEITPPVHAYPFQSHLILYVIEQTTDVFILRIRHGREDWMHAAF